MNPPFRLASLSLAPLAFGEPQLPLNPISTGPFASQVSATTLPTDAAILADVSDPSEGLAAAFATINTNPVPRWRLKVPHWGIASLNFLVGTTAAGPSATGLKGAFVVVGVREREYQLTAAGAGGVGIDRQAAFTYQRWPLLRAVVQGSGINASAEAIAANVTLALRGATWNWQYGSNVVPAADYTTGVALRNNVHFSQVQFDCSGACWLEVYANTRDSAASGVAGNASAEGIACECTFLSR